MSAIWLLLAVANANAWLFPSPSDKLGWGLRVNVSESQQVLLAKECVWDNKLSVALVNYTREEREYAALETALKAGDLIVSMRPNVTLLHTHNVDLRDDPAKSHKLLLAGQVHLCVFKFPAFSFHQLQEPGEYELRAKMKTTQGLIVAPVVKLKVIEPTPSDILESKPVLLEGQFAKWSKERQDTAVIQQIKIGNRTWLYYRQFSSPELGGKVSHAFRIAELPGKVVDFKVEGAFGDHNPLTITYRETTYTKWTTTHVINSVDGRPWTSAEEKHRQEKLKLEAKLPADKK